MKAEITNCTDEPLRFLVRKVYTYSFFQLEVIRINLKINVPHFLVVLEKEKSYRVFIFCTFFQRILSFFLDQHDFPLV